jgi:hypothetical protein
VPSPISKEREEMAKQVSTIVTGTIPEILEEYIQEANELLLDTIDAQISKAPTKVLNQIQLVIFLSARVQLSSQKSLSALKIILAYFKWMA